MPVVFTFILSPSTASTMYVFLAASCTLSITFVWIVSDASLGRSFTLSLITLVVSLISSKLTSTFKDSLALSLVLDDTSFKSFFLSFKIVLS